MLNLLALIVAVGVIAIGHQIEGGSLVSLIDLPAALIVFGGSIAAAIVQSDVKTLSGTMDLLPRVFSRARQPFDQALQKIGSWSRIVRAKGFLALESESGKESDEFLKRGLQMVIDGYDADVVRKNLEIELVSFEETQTAAAEVVESMGGYAPTLGILGAVLGLIQAMVNIESPELLGAGIATAFVATIYGVGSANLIFLPISYRMKSIAKSRVHYMEMLISGLEGVSNGENPRLIEQRLEGFRAVA